MGPKRSNRKLSIVKLVVSSILPDVEVVVSVNPSAENTFNTSMVS